jgi:hypothetical protein
VRGPGKLPEPGFTCPRFSSASGAPVSVGGAARTSERHPHRGRAAGRHGGGNQPPWRGCLASRLGGAGGAGRRGAGPTRGDAFRGGGGMREYVPGPRRCRGAQGLGPARVGGHSLEDGDGDANPPGLPAGVGQARPAGQRAGGSGRGSAPGRRPAPGRRSPARKSGPAAPGAGRPGRRVAGRRAG